MRTWKLIGSTIALAALLAPAVQAQDSADVRRLTILTFSAPVQLPGMTLPAGKYRFEMADVNNAAHVVRVLSEDGQKVIGTFPTTPSSMPTRDLRDTDTLVMFAERPAGQPQAAKEWYYPQRSIGEEFIYPRAQAIALAAANHTSVASDDNGKVVRVEGNESSGANTSAAAGAATTTPTDTAARASENRSENSVAENRARGQASESTASSTQSSTSQAAQGTGSARAVGTAGQSSTSGQSSTAGQSNTAGQNNTPRQNTTAAPAPTSGQAAGASAPARARRLPRTASQLSLFELLSALSIAGAFGVRHLRSRATARS